MREFNITWIIVFTGIRPAGLSYQGTTEKQDNELFQMLQYDLTFSNHCDMYNVKISDIWKQTEVNQCLSY